ncbi:hypothetical protein NC653_018954 [Populus alba x Populus x berolinensis]|uniref:Uncharacterized protein n=1 Tax=Populus alba x Populus x berolinensis TaxID=444605 RepID=A0AAD6QHL7_9ROSI|nr:hypothetical protein NC653_018954 [Populus alba x Populus x berolinensis]
MTWDQVSLANASQPGDYRVIVPELGDCISQVTNKYGSLPRIDKSEFSGYALSMPSHVSMPSCNGDSSSKENQPLEKRQRVRSSIQMNIEEIYTIQVQAEDVLEDILITNLPINERSFPIRREEESLSFQILIWRSFPFHTVVTSPVYLSLRSSSQAPPPSVIMCGCCGYGSDNEAIS